MKQTFYTKLPLIYNIILIILFIIVTIISCMLLFNLVYDFFICHKYWLNRRILLKYLNNKDIIVTKEQITNDITEYQFENFKVWLYEKQLQITLDTKDNHGLIGLFVNSTIEDNKVIEIIRKLNKL